MKLKIIGFLNFLLTKLSVVLLIGVLSSCGKNEFNLDFSLSDNISENFDAVYYATDRVGGLTVQAVASVMKGKCQLKGITKKPTLLYLTSRKSTYPLVIYVERGNNILIEGESNDPLSWNVAGNDINESLTEWRLENLQVLNSSKSAEINKKVTEFIENHTDNSVSLILLLCYFDRNHDEKDYVRLLSLLSDIDKKEQWITMAARADQMTLSSYQPARIETLVARSFQGGADTISFEEDAKPALLVFWQNDLKGRKEVFDSVKTLLREFPDSSSRIIADINLDGDSIAWINSLRRDSVKNISRLWIPQGFADRGIMKLKVGTLPYYIVLDKNGRQSYRGSNFGAATKEFRKFSNRKDTTGK